MNKFDPYRQWLGIPSDKQPATAYDILGLSADEKDAETINCEANIRAGFMRQHVSGVHSDIALEILDCIEWARDCMLKGSPFARITPLVQAVSNTQSTSDGDAKISHSQGDSPSVASATTHRRNAISFLIALGVGIVLVALFSIVALLFTVLLGYTTAEVPTTADMGATETAILFDNNVITLEGHTEIPLDVIFSPDGNKVVSASRDDTIKIWDSHNGHELKTLTGHNCDVHRVIVTPDGKQIISEASETGLYVWDIITGNRAADMQGREITFSGDGTRVALAVRQGQIRILDANTDEQLQLLTGHTDFIASIALSDNGNLLVSGSRYEEAKVKIWDVPRGQEIRTLQYSGGETKGSQQVVLSPDENLIVTGGADAITVWDTHSGKEIRTMHGQSRVDSLAYSSTGLLIASAGSFDDFITLWDPQTGEKVLELAGHPGGVKCVAFSPNGKRLVSCGADNTIKIWDIYRSRPETRNFDAGPVEDVPFKPDAPNETGYLDPDSNLPSAASTSALKTAINEAKGHNKTLLSRDRRIRTQMLTSGGGTTETEDAVTLGLTWLAKHQMDQGHWSVHQFNEQPDCDCQHTGQVIADTAATGLALLAFLGNGDTHVSGPNRRLVQRGLEYLIAKQELDGDLSRGSRGTTHIYSHAIATIALCEALAMTSDDRLREPVREAVNFLVIAQHPAGGWRYVPLQPGDASVTGWVIKAMHAAQTADLHVPPKLIVNTKKFLNSLQSGEQYSYQAGGISKLTMTADATLSRVYLRDAVNTNSVQRGVHFLLENHPPSLATHNLYYLHSATQLMFHHGGLEWEEWNAQMKELLLKTQETSGHATGSWTPKASHDITGGRLFATSMAVCCLETYYRYLPAFRAVTVE